MFRLSALALISFVSFGADPALLKLLPPSATVVAGIDVERASLLEVVLDRRPEGRVAQELLV